MKDHGVPFSEAMKVWARVAALSFGGPAGQIAVMHRIIVEEKKWVSDKVMRGNKALAGALSAITAAVVGVVLNLAICFAIHTVFREVQPLRAYGIGFDARCYPASILRPSSCPLLPGFRSSGSGSA